jgi:hypothetical protein
MFKTGLDPRRLFRNKTSMVPVLCCLFMHCDKDVSFDVMCGLYGGAIECTRVIEAGGYYLLVTLGTRHRYIEWSIV